LKRGYFAFGNGERGIGVARIDIGFAFSLGPAFHLFSGGKGEGRGAHNLGAHRRIHAMAGRFTGMNGARGGLQRGLLIFLHGIDYWPAGSISATTNMAGVLASLFGSRMSVRS